MTTAQQRSCVVSALIFSVYFSLGIFFRFHSLTLVPCHDRPGGFQDAGKDGKVEVLPVPKEEIGDVRQSISFLS
jgi:hypothetical protein